MHGSGDKQGALVSGPWHLLRRDGEAVKRAVELAVPAVVQAVAAGLARGRADRGGAARARELRVGGKSVGAGDLADQLRRRQRATAAVCEQLRRVAGDELGEF